MTNAIEITELVKSFAVKLKGRTTTLRMLTTLLPIDAGRAAICGYDLVRQPNEVRRRIGYDSQLGGRIWLEAEHIHIQSATISTPSLDDVFLKQTGRLLRDAKEGIA